MSTGINEENLLDMEPQEAGIAWKYNNAPLTMVTLRINTSNIPELSSEQQSSLQQAMMEVGLVNPATAIISILDVANGDSGLSTANDSFSRRGFFSRDRCEGLIIDREGIEWRVTKYSNNSIFRERIQNVLEKVIDSISFFGYAAVNQVSVRYGDLIVPENSRSLEDYFSQSAILPLHGLAETTQIDQYARLQLVRLVREDLTMGVSLEQYNPINKQVRHIYPDALTEVDPGFHNSTLAKFSKLSERTNVSEYAVMLMEATSSTSSLIFEMEWVEVARELNREITGYFTTLLNREVCDEDWEYVSIG